MNRIDVTCLVREYPDSINEYNTIIIRNHWQDPKKVVLQIKDKAYTIYGEDIMKAIENALNAH